MLQVVPSSVTRKDFNRTCSSTLNVKTTARSSPQEEVGPLLQQMGHIYDQSGIGGLLLYLSSSILADPYNTTYYRCNPTDLVREAVDVAGPRNKGKACAIINTWIASSCYCTNSRRHDNNNNATTAATPQDALTLDPTTKSSINQNNKYATTFAWNIWKAYDQISNEIQLYPDVVTLSLVYTALMQGQQHQHHNNDTHVVVEAKKILDRAIHLNNKNHNNDSNKEYVTKSTFRRTLSRTNVRKELKDWYDIDILYETDSFVVINKPSGMVCYQDEKDEQQQQQQESQTQNARSSKRARKRKRRANQNVDQKHNQHVSLEDILLEKIALSCLNPQGRGFVHRLDRGTSGCLLVAKTNEIHAPLLTQFYMRKVKKTYIALVIVNGSSSPKCCCDTDIPDSGVIDLPIDGRPSQSRYRVLRRYYVNNNKGYMNEAGQPKLTCLAQLCIETYQGRKHQVRIHCSKGLQSPIVLDPKYGGEVIMFQTTSTSNKNSNSSKNNKSSCSSTASLRTLHAEQKMYLHASTLSIEDYDIHVKAPVPDWWMEGMADMNIENLE